MSKKILNIVFRVCKLPQNCYLDRPVPNRTSLKYILEDLLNFKSFLYGSNLISKPLCPGSLPLLPI